MVQEYKREGFTTIEESQRLLKLGIPEESADCYIIQYSDKPFDSEIFVLDNAEYKIIKNNIEAELNSVHCGFPRETKIAPCWSGIRLIHIMSQCDINEPITFEVGCDDIEDGTLIQTLIDNIEKDINIYNFEKLK